MTWTKSGKVWTCSSGQHTGVVTFSKGEGWNWAVLEGDFCVESGNEQTRGMAQERARVAIRRRKREF